MELTVSHAPGHTKGSVTFGLPEAEDIPPILFSGDLGRDHQFIIRAPVVPDSPDILLCESTYGDRLHPTDDFQARLASIVEETAARGGTVVIPSFAVGRTQELLYIFRDLISRNVMRALYRRSDRNGIAASSNSGKNETNDAS